MENKRSKVWNYFTVKVRTPELATCTTCKSDVSRGGKNSRSFNTSNLWVHLRSEHADLLEQEEYVDDPDPRPSPRPSPRLLLGDQAGKKQAVQQTISSCFESKKPFPTDSVRYKEITKHLVEMIAIDGRPFHMVQCEGFQRFVGNLEPRYKLPSRQHISRELIPAMYSKVLDKVKSFLTEASFVAITTDMWSSNNMDDFCSVTCHFISNTMELHVLSLEAAPFPYENHTGDNIATYLKDVLKEWNLTGKVYVAVRDNARNLVAGLQKAELASVPCMAHTLQLVLHDGCLSQRSVVKVIATARKIAVTFHRSTVAIKQLKKVQAELGLPVKKLIVDEPTRWDSTFDMLERLIEQKRAICVLQIDLHLSHQLSNSDWCELQGVTELLRFFKDATLEVCAQNSSVSQIIPLSNALKQALQSITTSGLKTIRDDLIHNLEVRYPTQTTETNRVYYMATILDPRFKDKVFKVPENAIQAREKLIEIVQLVCVCDKDNGNQPVGQEIEREQASTNGTGLFSFCKKIIEENTVANEIVERNTIVDRAVMEVNNYLAEPVIDITASTSAYTSVLDYWKSAPFPNLLKLMPKYLCPPASSAESERLFSTCGILCNKQRNRLNPEKLKMMTFLKKNIKSFEFNYDDE